MFKNQLTGITVACAATIVALGMFGQATAMGQDSTQLATFRATALTAHNAARAKYSNGGVNPLTQSSSLDAGAQEWAIHLASIDRLDHASFAARNGNGENLFVAYNTATVGPDIVAAQMVNSWVSEAFNYDYSQPRFSLDTGHFTQVVWKSTTTLGCGYAIGSHTENGTRFNAYYAVCRYSPSGNVTGQFPANVPVPNPGVLADVFQWVADLLNTRAGLTKQTRCPAGWPSPGGPELALFQLWGAEGVSDCPTLANYAQVWATCQ